MKNNKEIMTSMTLRLSLETKNKFSKWCRVGNITQGDGLTKLFNNYKGDNSIDGINEDTNNITLLLRYQDYINDKHLESKRYICNDGEVLYKSKINKIYINNIEDKWKHTLSESGYEFMSYDFKLIKENDKDRYLIHQNFYIGNEYKAVFNIMNIHIVKDYIDIIKIIEKYTREEDKDKIEMLLAKEMTDEEFEDYLNKN